RVGVVHRSEIAESHALESSTARKLQNSTRRNHPPLRNCGIPRAATFHRPEISESHARQRSTAQELQNLTHGKASSLRNRRMSRAEDINSTAPVACYRKAIRA